MLDEPNVDIAVSETVPVSMGVYDDAVAIDLTDDRGVVDGGFVTEDAVVCEWAVELFETCRDEANPVSPEAVTTDEDSAPPRENQRPRDGPVR